MDRCRSKQQAKCNGDKYCASFSVRRILHWPRSFKSNSYSENNNHRIRYRKYLSILTIISCILSPKVLANTSQTAAPVANSSGSVTNMAVQNLQGSFIQNQYGGNIVCQGPMLTFSPFVTDSHTYSLPKEYHYDSPVYDDDGNIIYHQNIRTGQKDNFSFNLGFSVNFSIPLDNSLQDRCKSAVDNQLALTKQIVENKKLDYAIARIRECGKLLKEGIVLTDDSPYKDLCKDVRVVAKPVELLPHVHKISIPAAK
jgi:hypothetical protein